MIFLTVLNARTGNNTLDKRTCIDLPLSNNFHFNNISNDDIV